MSWLGFACRERDARESKDARAAIGRLSLHTDGRSPVPGKECLPVGSENLFRASNASIELSTMRELSATPLLGPHLDRANGAALHESCLKLPGLPLSRLAAPWRENDCDPIDVLSAGSILLVRAAHQSAKRAKFRPSLRRLYGCDVLATYLSQKCLGQAAWHTENAIVIKTEWRKCQRRTLSGRAREQTSPRLCTSSPRSVQEIV